MARWLPDLCSRDIFGQVRGPLSPVFGAPAGWTGLMGV